MTKRAIAKYSDIDDPKMIDGTYEQLAPHWDSGIATRSEAVQAQFLYLDEKKFPKVKDARPADFFDNSFVATLRKSGFLQPADAAK